MKILFVAVLTICFLAVPVMADTWTFDFTVQGDADYIMVYHKAMPDPMPSAQEFIDGGGFTSIQLPASSPQTFTLDYADGMQYGMYAEAWNANGDHVIVMDPISGSLSPTVWTAVAVPAISDAHYQVVIPDGSIPQIITDTNMTQVP